MNARSAQLLAWFLATLLVGSGIAGLYAATRHGNALQAKQRSLTEQRTVAEAELAVLRADLAQLATMLSSYEALQHRAAIGDEPRLAFIEHLQQLKVRHRLQELRFTIGAQQHVEPGSIVRHSDISLELVALHEGRLFDFLRDMRSETPGLPLIRGCSFERVPGSIRARCRMALYSFSLPEEPA